MKANELMIDDWVFYRPRFLRDEIAEEAHRVCHLDQFEGRIAVYENCDEYEDCYEPIPLTGEILILNGFKKIDAETYILETPEECHQNIVLLLEGEKYRYGTSLILIRSVHELQHLLRLCGLNELADVLKVEEERQKEIRILAKEFNALIDLLKKRVDMDDNTHNVPVHFKFTRTSEKELANLMQTYIDTLK